MNKKIIVTGGAGFIGSNLVERLLNDDRVEKVRIIDNLSNGYWDNVAEFTGNPKFEFYNADIRDYDKMVTLTAGFDAISHQAALGSVPRSIENPMLTTEVNINGTVNMLHAAVINKIDRVILACSSSTYGDSPSLPKKEEVIGNPLSPYAITKYAIEQYAQVFKTTYNLDFIGLRYFNVFGPKQSPDNPYAAVIPIFCKAFIQNQSPTINGDGLTTRDFTYVGNVIEANCLSIFTEDDSAKNNIYNVACGEQISLSQMVEMLQIISNKNISPNFGLSRPGDIRHSLADITKISKLLHYKPKVYFNEGLKEVYEWYKSNHI